MISLILSLFLYNFVQVEGSSLDNAFIAFITKPKNEQYFLEIVDNINDIFEKMIMSTELTPSFILERLPLGHEDCPHIDNDTIGTYYCLYEKNIESLHQNKDNKYNDTCTIVMNEYPYSSWKDASALFKRMIEDCIYERLKVLAFCKEFGIDLPIDLITNKLRKWVMIEEFWRNAQSVRRG